MGVEPFQGGDQPLCGSMSPEWGVLHSSTVENTERIEMSTALTALEDGINGTRVAADRQQLRPEFALSRIVRVLPRLPKT